MLGVSSMAGQAQRLSNSMPNLLLFTQIFLSGLGSIFSDPPGYLSISCGSSSNFTDPSTNLSWMADTPYIHTGSPFSFPAVYKLAPFINSLRYFSNASIGKNCYVIPVQASSTYLVRATFYYGNYDGLLIYPSFNVIFNANKVATVILTNETYGDNIAVEIILPMQSSTLSVCLGRIQGFRPLISALELRPLEPSMYNITQQKNIPLSLNWRYNMGALTSQAIRYPDDVYDRIWGSDSNFFPTTTGMTNISTSIPVSSAHTVHKAPSAVLQTARVTTYRSEHMSFDFPVAQDTLNNDILIQGVMSCYAVLYFAEIQKLNASDKRIFDILYANSSQMPQLIYGALNVEQLAGGPYLGAEVYSVNSSINVTFGTDAITFSATPQSNLGPILNAYEVYEELEPLVLGTFPLDVQTLVLLRNDWGLSSWSGDPCLPSTYNWEWLECDQNIQPRVTTIKLSNMSMSGSIPLEINNLTSLITLWLDGNNLNGTIPNLDKLSNLQSIYLQNNKLSGPIPESLAKLPRLKELFLQNNNLNGTLPQGLLTNTLLDFRYYGNPLLCQSKNSACYIDSTPSRRTNLHSVGSVIGLVIGPIGLLVLIASGIYFFVPLMNKKREARRGEPGKRSPLSQDPKKTHIVDINKRFSYKDVQFFTNNFETLIGKGGFGSVYYGKLPTGQEVAVKKLSERSQQGSEQFDTEVTLLTKIHHKYLVSLIGFCEELGHLMLIYEYMPQGDLQKNLQANASIEPLSWRRRLSIALNASEGLEYLHKGCRPAIIHRDVKSGNILLNKSYIAKVADFGLSKLFDDEETSQINTKVKGTLGYLDPEYHNTGLLTEKSDVYSFGVVLFEIVSGRKPLDAKAPVDQISLVEWAHLCVDEGRVEEIVDPRLEIHNMEALRKVAEIARLSTYLKGTRRPNMSEVVMALKEAMSLENLSQQMPSGTASSTSTDRTKPFLDSGVVDISLVSEGR